MCIKSRILHTKSGKYVYLFSLVEKINYPNTLVQCCFNVELVPQTLAQHWINVSHISCFIHLNDFNDIPIAIVHWSIIIMLSNLHARLNTYISYSGHYSSIVQSQYMLTLQVSNCLLALQKQLCQKAVESSTMLTLQVSSAKPKSSLLILADTAFWLCRAIAATPYWIMMEDYDFIGSNSFGITAGRTLTSRQDYWIACCWYSHSSLPRLLSTSHYSTTTGLSGIGVHCSHCPRVWSVWQVVLHTDILALDVSVTYWHIDTCCQRHTLTCWHWVSVSHTDILTLGVSVIYWHIDTGVSVTYWRIDTGGQCHILTHWHWVSVSHTDRLTLGFSVTYWHIDTGVGVTYWQIDTGCQSYILTHWHCGLVSHTDTLTLRGQCHILTYRHWLTLVVRVTDTLITVSDTHVTVI